MDCSTPGFPVHRQLPELAQIRVHRTGDAIEPSHPLLSPFSCLQSASIRVFSNELFASGGQIIGASAFISVLPMNIQDWFPLGLIGLTSLVSKGLSEVFSSTQFESINSLVLSFLYDPTLTCIHDFWKNHSFDCMDLCWQSNALLFNMLSRLVIAFLPRSKRLLISLLQSPSSVIWNSRK